MLLEVYRAMMAFFSRKIIRDFSWYGSTNIIVQGISFVSIMIVSRYLGPNNLGLMSFVQNYLGIVISAISGMDFYFTWHIVKSEHKGEEVLRFFIQKSYVTFFIMSAALLIAYAYFPKDVFILACIVTLPLLANGMSSFWLYALSEQKAKLLSSIQISTAMISLMVKGILVYYTAPLYMFAFISGLDLTINAFIVAIIILYTKKWLPLFTKIKTPRFVDTAALMFAIRYNLILTIFWQIVMRADQLLLAKITDAYTTGIYAAAVKLAEAPNVIVSVIALVSYTHVAHYVKESMTENREEKKIYMQKLKTIERVYMYAGCGVALFLVIGAPLFVHIVYGNKFLESIDILRIYAFSIPGLFVSYYYMALFGAYEERKMPAYGALCAAILTLFSVYFFTLYFGIYGTAFASVVSYTLSAFIFYFLYKQYMKNK